MYITGPTNGLYAVHDENTEIFCLCNDQEKAKMIAGLLSKHFTVVAQSDIFREATGKTCPSCGMLTAGRPGVFCKHPVNHLW